MNDEPNAGSQARDSTPSDSPRKKPRRKAWRRFVHYAIRKSQQRRAEREKKKANENPEQRAARKTANATVAVAIFTVVLAITSGFTLIEVVWGGSDTHALAVAAKKEADKAETISTSIAQAVKQMERQATAAQESAGAATFQAGTTRRMATLYESTLEQSKKSLRASIDASRGDQRAWVVPVRFQLSREPSLTGGVRVTYWVQNTGKTPGLNVSSFSTIAVQSVPPQEPVLTAASRVTSRGVLAPGAATVAFNTVFITPNTSKFALYQENLQEIWVRAQINYTDVFGENHWAKLCVWHARGMPLDSFSYCEEGNDVDGPDQQQNSN